MTGRWRLAERVWQAFTGLWLIAFAVTVYVNGWWSDQPKPLNLAGVVLMAGCIVLEQKRWRVRTNWTAPPRD